MSNTNILNYTRSQEISFIIPGADFGRAEALLSSHSAFFKRCRCEENPHRDPRPYYDPKTASLMKSAHYAPYSRTTIPPAHFYRSGQSNIVIELWKASCVLHPLDFSDGSADYVLDTPRREFRVKQKNGAPLAVINAISLVDAYRVRFMSAPLMREIGLLLSIRDIYTRDFHQWITYVLYSDCYIQDESSDSFQNGLLRETFREFILQPYEYKVLEKAHVLLFPEIPFNPRKELVMPRMWM